VEKVWLSHYESAVPHSLTYPQAPLGHMLDAAVARCADQPALQLVLQYLGPIAIGGRLTYRQLAEQTDRFAAALHALGVRKGDRVAVMLPNLPQFVIAFFGSIRLGAIVVNTNPLYTPREILQQSGDAGAETIVMLSGSYARLRQVQAETRIRRVILTDVSDYVDIGFRSLLNRRLRKDGLMADVPAGNGVYHFRPLLAAHPEPPPGVDVGPEDIALFQYTGGTTGVPKAAMLSHCNLVANILQVRNWLSGIPDRVSPCLGAIPFFHVYGMTVAMGLAIGMASRLIIMPSPRPIGHVMEVIQHEKPAVFPGVPAMYIGAINHPQVKRYDLRSIQACISGSAPLPMEVQVRFGEITGGRLVEGYGLTEAAPVTHCNPVFGQRKAGSIGVPLPDVEAKIVNHETLEEQPVGEPGELWVRGPQIMAGYWNQPDETAKCLMPGGWLRTGDIARMDEDGYFYIIDRLKDIIIVGGFNVVPREVEEVLFEHPKVLEAVVAGVPDPKSGEAVKAYVVLKPGQAATPAELIAFCRERLSPYKVPRQVEFRTELPKTMLGKFLRRVLVEEETRKAALVA
jgi:long-chain acyl-CoA synthetase